MTEIITIQNLQVELTRKSIKNLNLRIRPPHGVVKVSAPKRMNEKIIHDFILSRVGWIRFHQEKIRSQVVVRPPLTPEAKNEFLTRIPPLLEKWAFQIGVPVPSWSVKSLRSKWGSCNVRAGHILLNLELARHPSSCLEYVIIHELVHLVEPSHNHRFKRLMTHHFPEWKQVKKELNTR